MQIWIVNIFFDKKIMALNIGNLKVIKNRVGIQFKNHSNEFGSVFFLKNRQ